MINLNSLDYNTLSSELILNKVSEYQIFAFYIPKLQLNTATSSPLRDDDVPSFSVFYASTLDKLLFRDFATKEKGDCFVFVSRLFGLDYYGSLQKVANDFGLIENAIVGRKKKIKIPKNIDYKDKSRVHIGIKMQEFTPRDLHFWGQFGVSKSTLNKYNVFSCKYIFLNDLIIFVDNSKNPAYAYLESKDEIYTYKIYQPHNIQSRFISNVDKSVWQGWTQLPKRGEKLIITKSLKDVMSITEQVNIPAVSLQAETTDPKPHIVNQLKKRFDKVYLLYDNDFNKEVNWGRKYGSEIASIFQLNQIEIPDKYESKDFSDLVKNHGKEVSKSLIKSLIF
jgi:hypothetical protein